MCHYSAHGPSIVVLEDTAQSFSTLGERHLRAAVKAYTEHYHVERNHQGLNNELIEDRCGVADMNGDVERHERLAGILNYYYRRAA